MTASRDAMEVRIVRNGDVDEMVPLPTFRTEPLDEAAMERVPLGRSKFLRRLGATVFGLSVTSAVKASPLLACLGGSVRAQCGPSASHNRCCCCNAYSGCCDANCTDRNSGCGGSGPPWGWYFCYNHTYYYCRDFWSNGDACICNFALSSC